MQPLDAHSDQIRNIGDEALIEPSDDWPHVARSIMGEIPTSVALEAVDAAVARLQRLASSDVRGAFAASAEGAWWIAALDERLQTRLGGIKSPRARHYRSERNMSDDGRYVQGFLWARDRHTHQLPFSVERDSTPFLGGSEGVLHIGGGLVWLPASELHAPEGSRHERLEWREVYEQLMAGRSPCETLQHCSRWFHQMAGHDGV